MPSALDDAVLDIVSSANVACGGHAGDAESMRRTATEAKARGVRVGAHPSYPDRANFGRIHVQIDPEALVEEIASQIRELQSAAETAGIAVAYVKPHGALYNDAARDPSTGDAVVRAAERFGLPIMALAGSRLAERRDVPIIREGFLDRAYRPDGSLVPRSEPGALLTDPAVVGEHALRLASHVDSLSLHSDTPGAVELLAVARRILEANGYVVRAP
jgi:UPF0271 protein